MDLSGCRLVVPSRRRYATAVMQVFLSWSGERSREAAEALAKWLSQVIQAVEPWMSVDIEKGLRWAPEVTERLEKSRVGILCLTPENLESRWMLFEAGALSKTKDAYVCTLLIDLTPAGVEPPLGQFQHTLCEKLDIARLARTINAIVTREGEKGLSDAVLAEVFETFWPQLETKLRSIIAARPADAPPSRPQAEILDDILTTVRSLERRQAAADHDRQMRDLTEIFMRPVAPLPAEEWKIAYDKWGDIHRPRSVDYDNFVRFLSRAVERHRRGDPSKLDDGATDDKKTEGEK